MDPTYCFLRSFTIAFGIPWTIQDTAYSLIMVNTAIDIVITSLIQFHSFAFLIDLLISRDLLFVWLPSFSVERRGVPFAFDTP